MKVKLKILLVAIGFLLTQFSFAQKNNDTIPYKIGKYDIKKQEKVFMTAQRIGVDPNIIVRLNKLRNLEQDLVVGQRIKIPIYRKGYVYVPEKVVIHKAADLDSAKMALLYSDEDFSDAVPTTFLDPEEEKTKLMLIDASLELNQAMMEGLRASFDSLNVVDNSVINEKDVPGMLRKMKRSREKTLLTPYLETLRDSLTKEIASLSDQKLAIENKLNPPPPPVVQKDTVVSGADTIIYSTKTFADNRPAEKTIAAVIVKDDAVTTNSKPKIEVKRREERRELRRKRIREYFALDTVIIYDLPSTTKPLKPSPEKHTHQPSGQYWDTAHAVNQIRPKGNFWDTAHAVNGANDSALVEKSKKPVDVRKDSTVSLKIKVPNSNDSIIIKPLVKQKPVKETPEAKDTTIVVQKQKEKPKEKVKSADKKLTAIDSTSLPTDTVAIVKKADKVLLKQDTLFVVQSNTMEKRDTVSSEKTKNIVAKTEAKKESAELASGATLAFSDSVKKIKAEFFLKRAQKAMTEKNWKNADQYLQKSIELYPKYFDAWFALAEMDDLYGGSQQQALKEYKACAVIDSTQPRLFLNLGNLYVKMKRKTEAYDAYSKAILLQPKNIPALMACANILTDWKKYDAALVYYTQVTQIDRSYHYAYKTRGQVLLLNRNFKEAIDDFTRFLIFEETDPSAYYYRGLAKIGNNELLDGCLDLSTSASMGYTAAEKAIKKGCE